MCRMRRGFSLSYVSTPADIIFIMLFSRLKLPHIVYIVYCPRTKTKLLYNIIIILKRHTFSEVHDPEYIHIRIKILRVHFIEFRCTYSVLSGTASSCQNKKSFQNSVIPVGHCSYLVPIFAVLVFGLCQFAHFSTYSL